MGVQKGQYCKEVELERGGSVINRAIPSGFDLRQSEPDNPLTKPTCLTFIIIGSLKSRGLLGIDNK